MRRQARASYPFSFFALSALLLCSPVVQGQDLPEPLEKIRILLIIDEQAPATGLGARKDHDRLETFFQYLFANRDFPRLRKKTVSMTTLGRDEKITLAAIRSYFTKTPLEADEAFFLYISAAGVPTNEVNKEPKLRLSSGEEISHSQWLALVKEHSKSPLQTIIADLCVDCTKAQDFEFFPGELVREKGDLEPFYENLFFRHRGTMEIVSAGVGQPSCTFSSGSLMTIALTSTLSNPDINDLDGDRDGIVTWYEVFMGVRKRTLDVFLRIRSQANVPKLSEQEPSLLSVSLPFEAKKEGDSSR